MAEFLGLNRWSSSKSDFFSMRDFRTLSRVFGVTMVLVNACLLFLQLINSLQATCRGLIGKLLSAKLEGYYLVAVNVLCVQRGMCTS